MLVFLMQVGFMFLETGHVRTRNMSGIAIKNFIMLIASSLVYSLIGYQLMYGTNTLGGVIGWERGPNELGVNWQECGFDDLAQSPTCEETP